MFFANTTYFIPINDLYLLGILNSRAVWKYASENLTVIGDANKGGRLRFFTQFLQDLPIPTLTSEYQASIEMLVSDILAQKKKNSKADVSTLERQIDQIVYRLYDLTTAEITLIEGK